MNWIPKAKLWAVKAVKLGRMNINGSSGLRGANRPTEPTEFCKKECSGNSRVNFREYKESTGPVTAYITEIYQWVVKAVQVRKMMSTESCGSTVRDTVKVKETRSTVNCVHSDIPPPALINQAYVPANLFSKGGMDYKIIKQLKTFLDVQMNYHKTMAKTNKAAMKKIKKLAKAMAKLVQSTKLEVLLSKWEQLKRTNSSTKRRENSLKTFDKI
nr:uncharacterized protein LOC110378422 [Helicoverpa armigera]